MAEDLLRADEVLGFDGKHMESFIISPLCMYTQKPITVDAIVVEFVCPLEHLPGLLPILVHSALASGHWPSAVPRPELVNGQLKDLPFVAEYAAAHHTKLQQGVQVQYAAHLLAELLQAKTVVPHDNDLFGKQLQGHKPIGFAGVTYERAPVASLQLDGGDADTVSLWGSIEGLEASQPVTSVVVASGGVAAANGTYVPDGTYRNIPRFKLQSQNHKYWIRASSGSSGTAWSMESTRVGADPLPASSTPRAPAADPRCI